MTEPSIIITPLPNGFSKDGARISAMFALQLGDRPFSTSPFVNWPKSLLGEQGQGKLTMALRWPGKAAGSPPESRQLTADLKLDFRLWELLFGHIGAEKRATAAGSVPTEFVSAPAARMLRLQDQVYAAYATAVKDQVDAERSQLQQPAGPRGVVSGKATTVERSARHVLDVASNLLSALNPYVPRFAAASDRAAAQAANDKFAARAAGIQDPVTRDRVIRDYQHLRGDGDRIPTADAIDALFAMHQNPLGGRNRGEALPSAVDIAVRAKVMRAVAEQAADKRKRSHGDATPGPQEPTFPKVLAALGSFPELYRTLGLVIDFELHDWKTLAALQGENRCIWLEAPHLGGVTTLLQPRMAFELSGDAVSGLFVARGRTLKTPAMPDPMIAGGLLNLDYRVNGLRSYQLRSSDAIGTHLKLSLSEEAKANAADHATMGSADPDEARPLPADRSIGIELAMQDRGPILEAMNAAEDPSTYKNRRQELAAKLPSGGVVLYADDVVLGYRVDVWSSKSRQWKSLCRREGHCRIGGQMDWWPPAQQSAEPVYAEGFVRLGVTSTGESGQGNVLEGLFRWENWSLAVPFKHAVVNPPQPSSEKEDILRVEAKYHVPDGSLPSLRYGRGYAVRCRFVDVAGNSLAADRVPGFTGAFPSPPEPPFKYLRAEPLAAPLMLLDDVVDPEFLPAEQNSRMVVREGINDRSTRYAVVPRVPFRTAEMHSAFDGGRVVGALQGVWLNDDGTFPTAKQVAEEFHRDRVPNDRSAANNAVLVFDSEARFASPHDPYFPDPLVRRASLKVRDTQGRLLADLAGFPFYEHSWRNEPAPFRIELRQGTESMANALEWAWEFPRYDGTPASVPTLRLVLRKWEVLRLALSSAFDPDHPERPTVGLMRLWHLRGSPTAQEIVDGHHEMYSPPHEVTLVNAGRRPPVIHFQSLAIQRKLGDTTITSSGVLETKSGPAIRKCIGSVNIDATWTDRVDDVTQPQCEDRKHAALIRQLHVDRDEGTPTELPFEMTHEFRDTKYRKVRYTPTATSAFQDCFRKSSDADYRQAGDATEELVVPSSARPDAPVVLDIVPAFRWEERSRQATRHGGGLRVYLDRPWYSSGWGEQLAVVLLPNGGVVPPNGSAVSADHFTRWGGDPIWASGSVPPGPPAAAFFAADPGKKAYGYSAERSCLLPETGAQVTILAYDPLYEPVERRWYVDLEIQPGKAYMPHVRLALARYQEQSLAGCELSRVVLADFAQLTPDRSAVVSSVPEDNSTFLVTVTGTANVSSGSTRVTTMAMRLEEGNRISGDTDIDGWITVRVDNHESADEVPGVVSGETTRWTSRLPGRRGWPTRQRIVIEEIECYLADTGDDDTHTTLARRVVFAAVIPT